MNETHHPTPAAIRAAMNRLERAMLLSAPPGERFANVDMGLAVVMRGETPQGACGTLACHGGWYAYAKVLEETARVPEDFTWRPERHHNPYTLQDSESLIYEGMRLDFRDGREMLAADLGFPSAYAIMEWAKQNPKLWGNWRGYEMFISPKAFGRPFEYRGQTFPVDQIIAHWRSVADRIEAHNAASS